MPLAELRCSKAAFAPNFPLFGNSQILEQAHHRSTQTSGDDLQRHNSSFSLTVFDIRDVTTVHVQANRHIRLSPFLLLSQLSYTDAQGFQ